FQQNKLALQNAKFSLPTALSPRKGFKLTLDFLFVDAELCPSEIQDLARNILEIQKAGGQNRTRDAFWLRTRIARCVRRTGDRQQAQPSAQHDIRRKEIARNAFCASIKEIERRSAVRRPLGFRKLRRSRPP